MGYDLSIIIVSWNTCDLLLQCLRTLADTPGNLSVEVTVVDNGSTDGTAAAVKHAFAWAKVIRIPTNQGFAAGNNVGIKSSTGRYVMLLNSDTLVSPGALTGLVEFMERHRDVGAVGPRLLQSNGKPQPFAFGGDPTPGYLVRRGLFRLVLKRALYDWNTNQVQTVNWVSGACLLARREAIEKTGLLDENMFMYFEDNDWCLRIRRAGWTVCYNPQVAVIHLGGQSLKQNPAARRAYYQSLDYFYAKHYGLLGRWLLGICLAPYRWITKQ